MEWLARYEELIAYLLGLLGVAGGQPPVPAPILYMVPLVALLLLFLSIRLAARSWASRKKRAVSETAPQPAAERGGEAAAAAASEAGVAVEAAPLSVLERMRAGLAKTRGAFAGRLDELLGSGRGESLWEDLEELLIGADIGMKTALELRQSVQQRCDREQSREPALLRRALMEEIEARLRCCQAPLDFGAAAPFVLMVIGVNGVGKTTTIGKLAWQLARQEGKKVLVGACDTFRAAAAEQLGVWAQRAGAEFVGQGPGADPAGVAFDAVKAALARRSDVVILDTAGRLHTKVNLMEEVKKIRRVVGREIPGAPHETLLVLDATLGQNSLVQARLFKEAVDVSGLVLTKLDGTARGGMAVAVGTELGIPVRYVGIGEKVEDLRPFDPHSFAQALFERP